MKKVVSFIVGFVTAWLSAVRLYEPALKAGKEFALKLDQELQEQRDLIARYRRRNDNQDTLIGNLTHERVYLTKNLQALTNLVQTVIDKQGVSSLPAGSWSEYLQAAEAAHKEYQEKTSKNPVRKSSNG